MRTYRRRRNCRFREWIGGLDMVGRDEFEAVKAIAVAAREEAQALRSRIEALEAANASPTVGRARKSSGGAGAGKAGPSQGPA